MEKTGKILVVDDDPDMREALQMILESAGYTVVTAEDGYQCLVKLASERPDLLLLDLLMPNMDGLEVCRTLKSDGYPRDSHVPIIILSSVQEAVGHRRYEAQTGKRLEIEGYVEKPVESKLLLARVEKVMGNNGNQAKVGI